MWRIGVTVVTASRYNIIVFTKFDFVTGKHQTGTGVMSSCQSLVTLPADVISNWTFATSFFLVDGCAYRTVGHYGHPA